MRVEDLDGKIHNWRLVGHLERKTNKSSLHITARNLIIETYPNIQILEEVPIRITYNSTLFLDFYLPLYRKAIEVQGQHHYSYNSFFHKDPYEFNQQVKNDENKRMWCALNSITLICLPYDKTDEWESLIKG